MPFSLRTLKMASTPFVSSCVIIAFQMPESSPSFTFTKAGPLLPLREVGRPLKAEAMSLAEMRVAGVPAARGLVSAAMVIFCFLFNQLLVLGLCFVLILTHSVFGSYSPSTSPKNFSGIFGPLPPSPRSHSW